MYQFTKIM